MSRQVPFDIEVAAGRVPGLFRTPGDAEDAKPTPAIVLCGDLPGSANDHAALADAITERLISKGIAVAHFQPRQDDETASDDVATVIDDAAAVFRWLLLNDAVDPHAIGVLGVGLGAIIAAGVAARTNQVSRVCLVAPATNSDAITRLNKSNGAAPLLTREANEVKNEAWVTSLQALTPIDDIAIHDRPTLIVHGAADRVVESVRPYLDAVERAGHHVEHERIARADHLFTNPDLQEVCLDRVARFLDGLGARTGDGKKE